MKSMSKETIFIGLFVFSVFISAVSQILLKKSAMKKYESRLAEYLNVPVITAYGIFFFSALLTTLCYRYVDISLGAVLETLGYFFVMILGYLFLHEKITRRKLVGMFVVIAGILIFNM